MNFLDLLSNKGLYFGVSLQHILYSNNVKLDNFRMFFVSYVQCLPQLARFYSGREALREITSKS